MPLVLSLPSGGSHIQDDAARMHQCMHGIMSITRSSRIPVWQPRQASSFQLSALAFSVLSCIAHSTRTELGRAS